MLESVFLHLQVLQSYTFLDCILAFSGVVFLNLLYSIEMFTYGVIISKAKRKKSKEEFWSKNPIYVTDAMPSLTFE